jgi:hypothetical protein
MISSKFLIAALVGASAVAPLVPASVNAQRLTIEVGDRPYYNRGPYYIERGRRWCWIPGHWSRYRHRWVHGHYVRCRG